MTSACHVDLAIPTLTHLTLTDCPKLATLKLNCASLQSLRTAGTILNPMELLDIVARH